jgi:hypothetical protein
VPNARLEPQPICLFINRRRRSNCKSSPRPTQGFGFLTGLQFQERWIKQGIEGGKRAAYALRTAIAEQCVNRGKDVEIVAKIVANLSGLTKAMQRDGCIENSSDLKDFSLGFTQAKASFDFIDVGYGKERADSKIKGIFFHRLN